MRFFKFLIFFSFNLIVFGCKNDSPKTEVKPDVNIKKEVPKEPSLFSYLSPNETNILFKNTITETEQFNFLLYEYLYNGGGVAIGDINNDGLQDIYFSGNMVSNKLYLNQGNFKFKDITNSAGVAAKRGFKTGVSMVDINNDGLLDIYVCKSAISKNTLRKNELFINNGNNTFTEKAEDYGLADMGYSVQAYFFDSDGDNDLDVYVLNHPKNMKEANSLKLTRNQNGNLKPALPSDFTNISNRFYNNTNNKFTDVTKQANLLDDAFSLSAVIGDFNNDFRPDIYVCNDYVKPDKLMINQGNNTFKNQIEEYFNHTSFSSMGSDFADLNNNENLDLLTLDMSPYNNDRRKMMMMVQNFDKFKKMQNYDYGTQFASNIVNINNGNGTFSDVSFLNNVAQTEWSWSVLLADFDNDGLKDIHITNGTKRDITNNDYARFEMDKLQKQLNAKQITTKNWVENIPSIPVKSFLFQNKGNNKFNNVSDSWDSGKKAFSNGSAYADLNNDGYLDVIVNNANEVPFIIKNNGKSQLKNNYISVEFKHQNNKITTGTIGKLTLSNGEVLTEIYNPTRGFLSSSQHKLHFGIKKGLTADKLEIIWPNQKLQTIEKPELNQQISIDYKPTSTYKVETKKIQYFEDKSELLGNNFKHQENDFIDFKQQPLLHHKYSEEGPAIAIADVNKDGLDDVYFGGARDNQGQLYLQNKAGNFSKSTILDFELDQIHEDTDAIFFDANTDGNLDLYVASGGNESKANSNNYANRLYYGNGKGGFSRVRGVLPDIFESTSVVKTHDIDGDGDLDIFVGSRITPGKYPQTPKNYFLINENGAFKEQKNWGKQIEKLGMLTDAEFADLDNDGVKELILAGEWLPVSVFKFTIGTYANHTKDFKTDNKIGWWNSITIVDVNEDGFNDIVAGNLGLNSIFKASEDEPTQLYYADFDNNGSVDPVITTYNEGTSYPLHNRDRLLDQMPMLKKRFTRYQPYANATIKDVFTEEELSKATVLKANHFQHTLFINQYGKSFKAENLPQQTQISVLNDAVVLDLNNDKKLDIVSGGNFYGTDAEYGRYDASIGATLINNGVANFKVISASKSGLNLRGNVQQIKQITVAGKPHLLVIRNNEAASLVQIKK